MDKAAFYNANFDRLLIDIRPRALLRNPVKAIDCIERGLLYVCIISLELLGLRERN